MSYLHDHKKAKVTQVDSFPRSIHEASYRILTVTHSVMRHFLLLDEWIHAFACVTSLVRGLFTAKGQGSLSEEDPAEGACPISDVPGPRSIRLA